MPVNVNSMASGITMAVMTAARILPRNRNRMAITNTAPSSRFFFTVLMALSTRTVRSYTVTACTPFGRLRLISSIFLSTACETARLFCPISMKTVPSTTSRPFSVAAPVRSSRPSTTSATSRMRIATPCTLATTMLPMSLLDATWPGARISSCSPCFSIYPAPTLLLLRSSAVTTSCRLMP
ncbi:hypothetical protein D3C72_1350160 [compost metagenome]